jgi:hypothetical protein
VAVNYDKMEVSPKGLKQEMSVFSVPLNSGSLIGFENRRNDDGVVMGLYCEVAGYFEQQDIPFDLPRPSLNIPPTEEVRLRGSFIIRMPLEYIKATSYAYAYDSFDNKRRGGFFNVFIVNNQLDFLTNELSDVVGATHVRSSRDLHPLYYVRHCLPEEVLKATLSIRDTVRLRLCRAAQSQGVTDCKEIYMTRTALLMIMHAMQAFPSQSHPIHMVHTYSPPVSCPEMDFTQDVLLEMNNYYDNFEIEFRRGDNIPKLHRVRIYTQEQMMFLQRNLGSMFGVGARKRFGKAQE